MFTNYIHTVLKFFLSFLKSLFLDAIASVQMALSVTESVTHTFEILKLMNILHAESWSPESPGSPGSPESPRSP